MVNLVDVIFSILFAISIFSAIIGEASTVNFRNGWRYALFLQTLIVIMGICSVLMYICYCIGVRE